MNLRLKTTALMLTLISSLPLTALAAAQDEANCKEKTAIYLDKMGMVNEEVLQKHIDDTKQQMQRVLHGRGPLFDQKKELKRHLDTMQNAMKELHNAMYASGCADAAHGASLDVRLKMLETRLNMTEQLLEQLIHHINVQEGAEGEAPFTKK